MASPETLAAELLVFDQLAKNLRSTAGECLRSVSSEKAFSISISSSSTAQNASNNACLRVLAGMSLSTGSTIESSLLCRAITVFI
ncbi:hypothetical protein D3C85_1438230 [compost metagenome]